MERSSNRAKQPKRMAEHSRPLFAPFRHSQPCSNPWFNPCSHNHAEISKSVKDTAQGLSGKKKYERVSIFWLELQTPVLETVLTSPPSSGQYFSPCQECQQVVFPFRQIKSGKVKTVTYNCWPLRCTCIIKSMIYPGEMNGKPGLLTWITLTASHFLLTTRGRENILLLVATGITVSSPW